MTKNCESFKNSQKFQSFHFFENLDPIWKSRSLTLRGNVGMFGNSGKLGNFAIEFRKVTVTHALTDHSY